MLRSNKKDMRKKKGFTLIELSIVLVIIGLIVSSVLVGQDLVRAAELRALTRQYQEFQVAVNVFGEKYSQLPGDIQGDKFGFTGTCDGGAGLGDQNGLIAADGGGLATHDGEIECFWNNLSEAGDKGNGLIPGTFEAEDGTANEVGVNMPKMRFGPTGWGVFSAGNENFFTTGVSSTPAANAYLTENVFLTIDAFNIDTKIDNGLPESGLVVARAGNAADPSTVGLNGATAGDDDGFCVNTTPAVNEYNTANKTEIICNLTFEMQSF